MATTELPASHADLLERPTFAHLATVAPDGSPHSSVMWFVWDGEVLRFTHTTSRQKFKNIANEPRVAISIADPDDPYRSLEVRGIVEKTEPDDSVASFYKSLQARYGQDYEITDAAKRVILTVRPTVFVTK